MNSEPVWGIAYIKGNHLSTIDADIERSPYPYIRAAIPKIRILRKQFKNHQFFTEVPLLFNYGFFKLPYHLACDIEFLKDFKREINGIHGWLYKQGITENYILDSEDHTLQRVLKIYTVDHGEVMRLMKIGRSKSIYHANDINALAPGTQIALKGYPFEGMTGEIIEVNERKEEAKIKVFVGTESRKVTVSFGNLFYSVYEDFFGISLDSDKVSSFNEEYYGNKT